MGFIKIFALTLAIVILPLGASAAPATADQILKEVEKRVATRDESAKIQMTIVEANQSSKTREVEIRRKAHDKSQRVMVRLASPADLRGTALLSVSDAGKEEQWLYLPSSKQTRRILGDKRGSNFLDSELSYEDMGAAEGKKLQTSILRTEKGATGDVAVIESKILAGDSAYSKILTWVPLSSYLVSKIEYYDQAGKLLKVSEFAKYQKFGGGIWRAQEISVKNVQNQRSTRLQLVNLEVNKNLGDDEFSQTAMAED